ncbi:HAD-IIB family hydrolase [Shewanella polaris]|uniref:HAD-IIB family hydrolase n=1 Tax=Shewanella polaris TaxID=2588449 RepID=A0A4Y5YD94_9GAMM|nr:HAD-IIB family hydrolase [Shewanella polaris]QDE30486.1 HAD-IIB family hydrolase [Shewanella polaris]
MTTRPLIFTDIDGTLLDHFDYSFSHAIEVIEALNERQIPIIANTSKTFAEMTKLQQTVGFNSPFISENGAVIYIPIGYFAQQPEDTFTQGYYWVKEFSQPREYWLKLLNEQAQAFKNDFVGFSSLSVEELCELTDLSPDNAKLALVRHYAEPLLWKGDETSKQAFIKLMTSVGAHTLQGGRFLHVGGDTDKGKAMKWLADVYTKQYGTPVTTVALGDSGNDNAMLEAADIAIQIKSPTHEFPTLTTNKKTIKSTEYGPKGWAECINKTLLSSSVESQNNPLSSEGA